MIFEQFLHPDFKKLVYGLHAQGFEVAIVGGTVRDFYLKKSNKHDYDCEIRNKDLIKVEWKNLGIEHDDLIKLPYEIIKYSDRYFTCEFSMPRIEVFDQTVQHKNFVAKFDSKMSYHFAAQRRDFTINAMMYVYNGSWKLEDPLGGYQDLLNKKLEPCSDNFSKDPVRFLRAIRFSVKDNFTIPSVVKDNFHRFEIDDFPEHYLKYEASKSGYPLLFIDSFFSNLGLKICEPLWRELINSNFVDLELKKLTPFMALLSLSTQRLLNHFVIVNDQGFHWPFYPKQLFNKNFEQFKKNFKTYVNQFKWLENQDHSFIEFLFDQKMIDLTAEQVLKKLSIKAELTNIVPVDRSLYKIYIKLQESYEDC